MAIRNRRRRSHSNHNQIKINYSAWRMGSGGRRETVGPSALQSLRLAQRMTSLDEAGFLHFIPRVVHNFQLEAMGSIPLHTKTSSNLILIT